MKMVWMALAAFLLTGNGGLLLQTGMSSFPGGTPAGQVISPPGLGGPPVPAQAISPITAAVPADSDWVSQVQERIAVEEYEITWQDQTVLPDGKAAWQAPNRAQGFRTYFTEEGIRVVPRAEEQPSWTWGLELQAPDDRRQAADGEEARCGRAAVRLPGVEGNRITFDHGWITEWYVNSPEGLEQGFTIPQPLDQSQISSLKSKVGVGDSRPETRDSELSLYLQLAGNLHPKFSEDGQAVDFYKDGSFNILHYAELKVTDSTGRILPARFEGWTGPVRSSEFRVWSGEGGLETRNW